MITPKETVYRLEKLGFTDKEFRKIHHLRGTKGKGETVKSHIDYLANQIQKYQNEESDNYIVALRVECIEKLINQGFDKSRAINDCKKKYPFSKSSN